MPSYFDRFRLLNVSGPGAIRFRNESPAPIYVRAKEEEPQQEVLPGQEVDLPVSGDDEALIEALLVRP